MAGPGTELERILGRFGIRPHAGCGCKRLATIMDHRGCDWCKTHMKKILGHMQKEAKRRRLPFSKRLAKMLVRRAINKAAKQNGSAEN